MAEAPRSPSLYSAQLRTWYFFCFACLYWQRLGYFMLEHTSATTIGGFRSQPERCNNAPFDPETAATVASVGDGTRPVNSRSFHVHKTLPVDPMVLPGVCVRTTLGEDSHRTDSVSADTLPLGHDRKEEAPQKSLNLELVSATNVISLLLHQTRRQPLHGA